MCHAIKHGFVQVKKYMKKYDGTDEDSQHLKSELKKLGNSPPEAILGEPIEVSVTSGGVPVFWRGGAQAVDETGKEVGSIRFILDSESEVDGVRIMIERAAGDVKGLGAFNLDFLIYSFLGMDLSKTSKATLETLRLPARLLLPFIILILFSYLTRRQDEKVLDLYYAKMNTPVDADPSIDRLKLEEAYVNPKFASNRKIFPDSDLEFTRPTKMDLFWFYNFLFRVCCSDWFIDLARICRCILSN